MRSLSIFLGVFCAFLMVFTGCGDSAESETTPITSSDSISDENEAAQDSESDAIGVDEAESVDNASDADACETMQCGWVCGDGLFCDPEGVCREIGNEVLFCPSECLDAECGASCQPGCAIGEQCGYAGPGYCNPEGVCIIDVEDTGEPPFACPGE